jgi:hypothetical protein
MNDGPHRGGLSTSDSPREAGVVAIVLIGMIVPI